VCVCVCVYTRVCACVCARASRSLCAEVRDHTRDVTCIAASSTYSLIVSGSADCSVLLYEWALGSTPTRFNLGAPVCALCFLEPLPLLVASDATGSLYLFHCVPSFALISRALSVNRHGSPPKAEPIISMCWDASDQVLFTSDDGGMVRPACGVEWGRRQAGTWHV
jgi:hypothetical protein